VSRIEKDDVTVAVVLALTKEMRGAQAMFADESELQDNWGSQDGFHCGACQIPSALPGLPPHTVVLAQPPRTGNNHAAICATRLRTTFRSLEAVICCGIAGAAPSPGDPERDVHLGDIVIASGDGVLQYDFGHERLRDGTSEYFLDTSREPRAPGDDFVNISHGLMDLESRGKPPWVTRLNDRLPLLTRLNPLFARPQDPAQCMYERFVGDQLEVVQRIPPYSDPKLFVGAIGSANRVLKNPRERDRLRDGRPRILAIEMESAGVADACHGFRLPFTTVRGIADYCDGYKRDHWQFYAAAVAAACTYSVIERLPASSRRMRVYSLPGRIANNDASIERVAFQAVGDDAHSASSTVSIIETSTGGEIRSPSPARRETQTSEPVEASAAEHRSPAPPTTVEDLLRAMANLEAHHDWKELFHRAQQLEQLITQQADAGIPAKNRADAFYQVARAYTSYRLQTPQLAAVEQQRLRDRAIELVHLAAMELP
jgi:nucleoside phosphorylase